MQYVFENKQLVLIQPNHGIMKHQRLGEYYVAYCITGRNRKYVDIAIDGVLKSDLPNGEKVVALEYFAEQKLISLVHVRNNSRSTWNRKPIGSEDDHYIRFSALVLTSIIDGIQGYSNGGTCRFANEQLQTLMNERVGVTDSLEGLKQANLINDFIPVELPWVDNFEFAQPKGSVRPHDFKEFP